MSAVLATTDPEIEERIRSMLMGGGVIRSSGRPPLVAFMPMQLLARVKESAYALAPPHGVRKLSALACVVADMTWGTARSLPRLDNRLGDQAGDAETMGTRMTGYLARYASSIKAHKRDDAHHYRRWHASCESMP